jgi:serine/threonine protein kinase
MTSLATVSPGPRYRLLAKWGSGGMADVYVARHAGPTGFDKIVAIKLLRESDDAPGFRQMFLEEVRTAALLSHPSIVQTFDAGELGDRLYMAMEFVNGETLGRFARAVIRSAGAFPCELALAIVRDLTNALEYAHTLTNLDGVPLQLVHRDVSPSNVLVSFDGMVKLLDFGIAKVATQAQLTGAGVIKGKFSYMSPEQARGEQIDQRADIYSLGVVLWQLLTGRAAFHAPSDAELLRRVIAPNLEPPSRAGATCSKEVDEIVMSALAPDPYDRYQSAGEFATELGRYLTRHAAGFDSTKVLRGLMAAHFHERRERLNQIVRSAEREVSLADVDLLANQPSIRTPAPRVDPVGTATAPTLDAIAIGAPVTVAPTTSHAPPPPSGRWQSVTLLAAVIATAGYITIRETRSPVEPAPATRTTGAATGAGPAAGTVVTAIDDSFTAPDAANAVDTAALAPESTAVPVAPDARPSHRGVGTSVAVRDGSTKRDESVKRSASSRATAPRSVVARPSAAASRTTAAATRPASVGTSEEAAGGDETDAAPVTADDDRHVAEPRDAGSAAATTEIDAGMSPPRSERRTKPVETAGSLDAVPRVTRVAVDGSLPTSEIRTAIGRVQSTLRACYRDSARRAARTPAFAIKVSFEIDEARAARGVRISGDTLGVAGCVGDALSGLRTRVAPDVGTVSVTAVIQFDPVDD